MGVCCVVECRLVSYDYGTERGALVQVAFDCVWGEGKEDFVMDEVDDYC